MRRGERKERDLLKKRSVTHQKTRGRRGERERVCATMEEVPLIVEEAEVKVRHCERPEEADATGERSVTPVDSAWEEAEANE
jgi:hypothetical protein